LQRLLRAALRRAAQRLPPPRLPPGRAPRRPHPPLLPQPLRRAGCTFAIWKKRPHRLSVTPYLAQAKEAPMIQQLSHPGEYVLDQERDKKFYTETLGFEVKEDVTMGDFRWLTVAPKGQDINLVLMPLAPSPMMDEATVKILRGLVEKGVLGGFIFETADCKK